jgi:hypothetical protein
MLRIMAACMGGRFHFARRPNRCGGVQFMTSDIIDKVRPWTRDLCAVIHTGLVR